MNKTEQSSILSLRSYTTKRVVTVKNLGLFGLFKFNLIPKPYESHFHGHGHGHGLEGTEHVPEFSECPILPCISHIIPDTACIISLLSEFCRLCSDDIVSLSLLITSLLVSSNDNMYSALAAATFSSSCSLEPFNMETSMGIPPCRPI